MADMNYASFGHGSKIMCIIPGISLKRVVPSIEAVKKQYSCLENEYTVYLFDRKNGLEKGATLRSMADDTVNKLRELNIEKATFFGTSQGAMMIPIIAAEHPDLVERAVLAGSCPHMNDSLEKSLDRWADLAERREVTALADDMYTHLFSKEFMDKYRNAVLKMYSDISDEDIERFIITCRGCTEYLPADEHRSIKCPVTVFGAENDLVLTGQASRELADSIGCKLIMYPAPYLHAFYDECPDFPDALYKELHS